MTRIHRGHGPQESFPTPPSGKKGKVDPALRDLSTRVGDLEKADGLSENCGNIGRYWNVKTAFKASEKAPKGAKEAMKDAEHVFDKVVHAKGLRKQLPALKGTAPFTP